ncbi:MAG: CDP-diacylglycerol diphosphatase [Stellaceae bacterium]
MRLYRAKRARPAVPPGAVLLLLVAVALAACATAEPAGPSTKLWPLVQRCIANREATGDPAPCLLVDPAKGYAILRDIRGTSQFLLVATDRRRGIEDRRIEASDAPNYFADAWSARGCVAAAAGYPVPDSDISLAINSIAGRSDGQLHIHIDRLRPGIATELSRDRREVVLAGHRYRLRHLDNLADTNLFAVLGAATGGAIGDETIVVAGDPRGGFFVLDDHVHDGDPASGEELQVDHPLLTKEQLAAENLNGCADPARSGEPANR